MKTDLCNITLVYGKVHIDVWIFIHLVKTGICCFTFWIVSQNTFFNLGRIKGFGRMITKFACMNVVKLFSAALQNFEINNNSKYYRVNVWVLQGL